MFNLSHFFDWIVSPSGFAVLCIGGAVLVFAVPRLIGKIEVPDLDDDGDDDGPW